MAICEFSCLVLQIRSVFRQCMVSKHLNPKVLFILSVEGAVKKGQRPNDKKPTNTNIILSGAVACK